MLSYRGKRQFESSFSCYDNFNMYIHLIILFKDEETEASRVYLNKLMYHMTLETYPRTKPLIIKLSWLECCSIMLPWASYLTSIKNRFCFWKWVVCTFKQDILSKTT